MKTEMMDRFRESCGDSSNSVVVLIGNPWKARTRIVLQLYIKPEIERGSIGVQITVDGSVNLTSVMTIYGVVMRRW